MVTARCSQPDRVAIRIQPVSKCCCRKGRLGRAGTPTATWVGAPLYWVFNPAASASNAPGKYETFW
jgi:hypothetical protein